MHAGLARGAPPDGDSLQVAGVYNDAGVTYGDVFLENERQMSKWNFEVADTDKLLRWFKDAETECRASIAARLPLAAYDQAIKASHVFNLLQARGVISVQERASYMSRVREMAKGSCMEWIAGNWDEWNEKFPGWTAV